MIIGNKYLEVFHNLGWDVTHVSLDNSFDLEKRSPAGEYYHFTVYADSIEDDVDNEASYFNVDDHVIDLIKYRGQYGVPNTIRGLLDDAEAIKAMLNELADALESTR